ncbi:hypothetical protein RJT34_11706 [Clitoria ternatea]|uniref:DUF4283 domain-containing protein n=1 Tax=Clitoria ternatea TaxID=43366 RepID=A0AAN9JKF5_CLITE
MVDNAGAGGGRGQVPPKSPDIRVSFKEKVLGRATGDPQPVENLIKRGIMTLDNENRLLPRFTMEEDDYQPEEKERVIMEGPWLIFDHYLSVMHWHPDFMASQAKIDKTLVWIRFPGLGLEFYNESVLLTLASAVGTPYKVDMRTLQMERGRFARIVVKRNNKKPNIIAISKENGSWNPGTTSMSGATIQDLSNGPSRDHMKTNNLSTRSKRPRRPTPSRESRERTHGSSTLHQLHAGDLDLHQANLNIQPTIPLSTCINMQGTTMDDLDQHQGEFNIYPPSNSPIMRMKPKGTATATHAHTSSSPGIHARDYGMEQHGLRKIEDNSSTILHHFNNEETMLCFGANHPQCPSNSDQGTSSADKEKMFVFTQKPPDGVSC